MKQTLLLSLFALTCYGQAPTGAYCPDTSVSANTITCSTYDGFTGYGKGMALDVLVKNSVTGATTMNVDGLGAKAVTYNGTTTMASGVMVAGGTYRIQYDGTEFVLQGSVGGTGGAPSGPAGGVLSGTYPNPGAASSLLTNLANWTGGAFNYDCSGCTSFSLPVNSYWPMASGVQTGVAGNQILGTPSASRAPFDVVASSLGTIVTGYTKDTSGNSCFGNGTAMLCLGMTSITANRAPAFQDSGGTVALLGNTLSQFAGSWATSQAPVVTLQRPCSIVVGANNGAALANADLGPQGQQCKVPYAATLLEIDINADAGTPSILVNKKHCGTFTAGVCTSWTTTALLSSALSAAASNFDACSNTGGTTGLDGGTTCSATLQNTALAAGDWIELTSGTAGGTAKRVTIVPVFKVN